MRTAPPAGVRFYTTEEAERIIYAWARLMDFAEASIVAMGTPAELTAILDDQVKRLEGYAEPLTQSRALLLGALASAAETQHFNLWFYEAPRRAIVAYSWAFRDELVDAGVMRLARKAHDTHRAALRRYSQSLIGA